jgi:hypothetical protein
VERQRNYYLKLWRRAQANDMPIGDPLVAGICRAWEHVNALGQTIERLQRGSPPLPPLGQAQ